VPTAFRLVAFGNLTGPASPPTSKRVRATGPGPLPAVSVAHLTKRFRVPHQQFHTLKERALHPIASRTYDEFTALRDVTFDVARGEFFGIVGRNGSGKSTLLKCLAGIYCADEGRIGVEGRLSPFIELGVGFHPEMNARDNVLINAILLGLSRKQARARFDEIIAFAELEEFVDLKLKNYSSGMSVRLGFAVAVQVDADVLLVDEVLAVGDASFQQKCFEQFDRLKAEGRTILFVTHDMGAVRRFCDRATLVERGDMLEIGDPEEISRMYEEINFGGIGGPGLGGRERLGVRVTGAWCEDASGDKVLAREQGLPCVACMEVEFDTPIDDPRFSIAFRNATRHTIYVPGTDGSGERRAFGAGERLVVCFHFDNWLAPSRYTLTPRVASADGRQTLDIREDLGSLIVDSSLRSGGVADIPADVEVRPL